MPTPEMVAAAFESTRRLMNINPWLVSAPLVLADGSSDEDLFEQPDDGAEDPNSGPDEE